MHLTETQFSNLNKLRVYFSHRIEAPRQIVRLGPHYPQGTSQMWLLWLLVPVKWPEHLHASYPCPNSKKGVELSKNVHTRLVYSLLIRKTITFHRHPTSRLLYLIVQNEIHGYKMRYMSKMRYMRYMATPSCKGVWDVKLFKLSTSSPWTQLGAVSEKGINIGWELTVLSQ